VRIIAATHQNLVRRVAEGLFRSDLLFRINAFPISLPALKDSPEKIIETARSYLNELGAFDYEMAPSFSQTLMNYGWPGNYRELRNVIAFAHTLSETKTLLPCHLPSGFDQESKAEDPVNPFPIDFQLAKEQFERSFLTEMLYRHGGRVNLTARETKISKVTLIDKIRRFGIDVNAIRISAYQATNKPELVRYI
jgi:DNA-binding NtrC family response regulator